MGRPREFDEEEAVGDAMQAFWKRGYASTSIPDLIAATDLERGSIYKAFGDKHSLFERALDTYLESGRAGMRRALEGAASPLAGIKAWLRAVTDGCSGEAGGPGCMAVNAMVELGPDDPVVRDRLARHWSAVERRLEATLAEGQACGEIRRDLAPRDLARIIVRAIAGIAVFARQGASTDLAATILSLIQAD
jgi:TetR/AcrR family transcriptional repressor of nem operon